MRKIYRLVLLLIFSSFPFSGFAGERIYPVFLLSKEPVLDGKIVDDPAWSDIPLTTGFFRFNSREYALKQTSFHMGYITNKALYLGLICQEPEMKKIKAKLEDGNIGIWAEDSVEIFLFPHGADNYYQFMINAIGSRWNGIGIGEPYYPLWNWEVKSYKAKDFYSLEIKIPFKVLGRIPKTGEVWEGNFCRNSSTFPEDRFTRWGVGGFHDPVNFVPLVFGRQALEERIRKMENDFSNWEKEFLKVEKTFPQLKEWKKIKEKLIRLDKVSHHEIFKIYEEMLSFDASLDAVKKDFLRDLLFAK